MHVLAIGAHPDDIELGCAGALLAHRARGDAVSLLVLSTGERGPQAARSRVAEQQAAAGLLGATLHWGGFDDCAVPSGHAAVERVEKAMADCGADIMYVHAPADSHQDHRAAAAAALAAARWTSRVLLYEGPTSQGFDPAVFVDVAAHLDGKLAALRAHASQVAKNRLVDLEAIEALARYRGFQARLRIAEAFELARLAWDLSGVDAPASGAEHGPASAPAERRHVE